MRTRLTERFIDELCKRIRASKDWPHAQAALFGISTRTFQRWMDAGRELLAEAQNQPDPWRFCRDHPDRLCAELAIRVERAMAAPRGDAARRLFSDDPKAWLQYGPARDDWGPRQQVRMEGALEHSGSIQIEVPIRHRTLAEALELMQEMGLVQPGPNLTKLLTHEGEGNGNEQQQDPT